MTTDNKKHPSHSIPKGPQQQSRIGMAIRVRPVDTWFGPTLMGQILPDPINNRVGNGFLKKQKPKWVQVGFGF